VVATGSTPLRLNVPGSDLAVCNLPDSRDVDLLLTLPRRKSASWWSERVAGLKRPMSRQGGASVT